MKRVLPVLLAAVAVASCSDHDPASPVAPSTLAAPPTGPKGGPDLVLIPSATAAVLDLPTGYVSARASGVNAAGLAVGSAVPGDPDDDDIERAVVWNGTTVRLLPLPGGATGAEAREVNASGTAVGYMNTGDGLRPLRWMNADGLGATVQQLSIAGYDAGEANDVNADGVVVGVVYDGNKAYAARWATNGALEVLDDPPFAAIDANSYATAVNDAGQIAGYFEGDHGRRAFRWTGGTWEDVGVLSTNQQSTNETIATDINAAGVVAGFGSVPIAPGAEQTEMRAFRWTPEGGPIALPPLPGATEAQGYEITDDGQVLGFSEMFSVRTPVLWSPSGHVRAITGLSGTGAVSATAFGANAAGTVVGAAGDDDDFGAIRWDVVLNQAPVANAGGPYTVDEGSPLTFDGTASSDPDGDPLLYAWNFGDGGSSTAGDVPHTYDDEGSGTYTATLTVRDREGGTSQKSDVASAAVTVRNVAPVVTLPGGDEAVINRSYTLRGEFADPGKDDPWTIVVNWGDETSSTKTVSTQGSVDFGTHTYSGSGTKTVTVTVTDEDGDATTRTLSLSVRSAGRPMATILVPTPDEQRFEGTSIAFDGSKSSDTDGDAITSYQWNFGDGTTGTGVSTTHSYADDGTYTVTLVVDDGVDGASTPTTFNVTVLNAAPTFVDFVPTATTLSGRPYAFKTVFNDAGKKDGTWSWLATWGVGSASTSTTASAVQATVTRSYTYKDAGTRFIGVTVRDKDGASVYRERVLTVLQNQAPAPAITPPAATYREGQSVRFTATANDADDADSLSYSWNFGNTRTSTAATPSSTTYPDNGSYKVRLSVKDPSNATGADSTQVTIVNVAPTGSFSIPSTLREGTPFTLRLASATDSGTTDRSSLQARFSCGVGDSTYASDWKPVASGAASQDCAARPNGGTDTLFMQIRDKDGGVRRYRSTRTWSNVTPVITLGAPAYTVSGTAVTVNASFADPGADAPWSWTISWGDGVVRTRTQSTPGTLIDTNGAPPVRTYAKPGSYTVRITLKDDVSTSATAQFTVVVP